LSGTGQVLVRVHTCGGGTDLHLLDGEVDIPRSPGDPGHQIVGVVLEVGERAAGPTASCQSQVRALASRGLDGHAVVAATASAAVRTCASCSLHRTDIDGGFAELAAADARYCWRLASR
jgi:alcohol dehydrogenase, propanol-preferring